MDSTFDPNVPDCSKGDFFCKLCLASMNSEQMWSSHIVGRRHIKNVTKYANGLPKRFEDEKSYDRIGYDSYDDDSYPPKTYDDYYHGSDYYDMKPIDYVPTIRPNVVIDYGHSKKLEEILPENTLFSGSKTPEVASEAEKSPQKGNIQSTLADHYNSGKNIVSQAGKIVNVDDILNEIKSEKIKNGSAKIPEKDDFFEKINQRELARDLALQLSKSRFGKKEVTDDAKHSPKCREAHKRKQDDECENEKRSRQRSSRDIIDMFHEYNDDILFKGSKIENSDSSSKASKKLEAKLNKINPDELTPDIVDDLLSSRLPLKAAAISNQAEEKIAEKLNMADPEVISEQLQKLPNKIFFKLIHDQFKKIELQDSEELKILLNIISEAQEIVTKKLPEHIQFAMKAKLSGSNSEKREVDAKKSSLSLSHTVAASVTTQMPSAEVTKSILTTTTQAQSTAVSQSCNVPLVSPFIQNAANQGCSALPSVPSLPPPVVAPITSSVSGITPCTSVISIPAQILSTKLQLSGVPLLPPPPLPVTSVAYSTLQNPQVNTASCYPGAQAMNQMRQPVAVTNTNSLSSTVLPIQPNLQPSNVSLGNNSALYYQMMQAVNQIRQPVPVSNANSVSSTVSSVQPNLQPPSVSQANNTAFYYRMMQPLNQIRQPIPVTNTNSVSSTPAPLQPNLQPPNVTQANNTALYYQMMQAMYQMRQPVPVINANLVSTTVPSMQPNSHPPNISQGSNAALYYQMMQAMNQIRQPVRVTNANSLSTTLPTTQPNSQPATTTQGNDAVLYYQMMQAMNQMKQQVPVTTTNSVTSTSQFNLRSHNVSQSNLPASKNLDSTLQHLAKLAEDYKSKKLSEASIFKTGKEQSKEKYGEESSVDHNDKYRKEYKDSRRDR